MNNVSVNSNKKNTMDVAVEAYGADEDYGIEEAEWEEHELTLAECWDAIDIDEETLEDNVYGM